MKAIKMLLEKALFDSWAVEKPFNVLTLAVELFCKSKPLDKEYIFRSN
jgi:hypothetical protein